LSEEAYILDFCRRWLPAWTGNDPDLLISFYADNVWVWEVVEVFPTPRGFSLKWRATIPVGRKKLIEHGMDIVELENGKITRNEIYFDRSRWLDALPKKSKQKSK